MNKSNSVVLFLSYAEWDYNGRTQELLKVASSLGELYAFTRGRTQNGIADNHIIYRKKTFVNYVFQAFSILHKIPVVDVLFVDNRKAAFVANLILKQNKIRFVFYDMRELYVKNEVSKFSSKLGCFFEERFLKKVNAVICANEERMGFVKRMHKLSIPVLCFENIRKLEYSESVDIDLLNAKYSQIIKKNSFKIISTSGLSVSRGIDKLLEAIERSTVPIEVILAGPCQQSELEFLKNFISNHNAENIHYVGRVYHDELKYLISHCDCGIVSYHSKDTNNKYCASGKIYEFLFEGIPVITTSNPPLKNFVDKYGIGCSAEDYELLLKDMIDNYTTYRENAKKYRDTISIEENVNSLVNELKNILVTGCNDLTQSC